MNKVSQNERLVIFICKIQKGHGIVGDCYNYHHPTTSYQIDQYIRPTLVANFDDIFL